VGMMDGAIISDITTLSKDVMFGYTYIIGLYACVFSITTVPLVRTCCNPL
jgi:hypothetical protein